MEENEKKHAIVRDRYAETAKRQSSCCTPTPSCCGADAKAQPVPEAEMGLSCGNPVAFSELKPGDVVVDLGSGGGRDVFPAAEIVGKTGKVIGVDMTREMIDLADKNAETYRKKTGLDNVEFRFGKIEELPVEDGSVDVVISNCVINLSPDKPQVFGEIFRVLKPGGKMVVSDIVLKQKLPQCALEDDILYTSCIAGAMLKNEYLNTAKQAGFDNISIENEFDVGNKALADPIADKYGDMIANFVSSITIIGVK
ncbi:MAG: arsenite methyltransferase [Planctomycetota bacterium]|nr:MAG: arsenite methyltransferase [Planctomycetota bacterium]